MIEIEIKLPFGNENIEQKLLDENFERGIRRRETDTYFCSKTHDFRTRDEALRIRRSENVGAGDATGRVVTVNFKGPKIDPVSMTREELEVEVSDAVVMEEIFRHLELVPVTPVIKERQYYHRGRMTACVDRVENLGKFLELEVLADEEERREDVLRDMWDVLGKLGHDASETVRTSYLSMLEKNQKVKD